MGKNDRASWVKMIPKKDELFRCPKNDPTRIVPIESVPKMIPQDARKCPKNDPTNIPKMIPNKDNIGIYKDIRIFNKLNILFKRSKDIHGFDMFEPGSGWTRSG